MDTAVDEQAPLTPEEAETKRAEAQRQGYLDAGEPTELPAQDDYFGFDETFQCFLPDKVSYIEHKALDEGSRRKYLNKVNRDVRLDRAKGDAHISLAPGDERHALLSAAIVGWNLASGGQPVPFNTPNLNRWLEKANPKVVDLVEKDIRLSNPWLLAEMTVEDIDREIESLQEMRERVVEEELGKGASS